MATNENKRIKDLTTIASAEDIKAGNYFVIDTPQGTKKLGADEVLASLDDVIIRKKFVGLTSAKKELLFTSSYASEGDVIFYDITCDRSAPSCIQFLDSAGNALQNIGRSGSSISRLQYKGNYTIPANFSRCVVFGVNGASLSVDTLCKKKGSFGSFASYSPYEQEYNTIGLSDLSDWVNYGTGLGFTSVDGKMVLDFTDQTIAQNIARAIPYNISSYFFVKITAKSDRKAYLEVGVSMGTQFGYGARNIDRPMGWQTCFVTDTKYLTYYVPLTTHCADNANYRLFLGAFSAYKNYGANITVSSIEIIDCKTLSNFIKYQSDLKDYNTGVMDLQSYIINNKNAFLPEGHYTITEKLVVLPYTTIRGCGAGTILELSGSEDYIMDVYPSETLGVSIRDITFIGKQEVTPAVTTMSAEIANRNKTGCVAIFSNGYVKNITIENCIFKNFDRAAILLSRSHTGLCVDQYKISKCVFKNNYVGLRSSKRSEYHCVSDCTFAYNQIGAMVEGGNNFFSCCHFDANSVGFFLYGNNENDGHGSVSSSSFNHNKSKAIMCADIHNGFTFVGCHCFEHGIEISNTIGFVFDGGIISAKDNKMDNSVTSSYIFSNNLYFNDSTWSGNTANMKQSNNWFLNGNRAEF